MVLAESLGDAETLVHALNNVGTAQLTAQDEQGRAHLERSLQLALERGWEDHVARAYTNLACCAVSARAYPLAERLLQDGLAYCAEHDIYSCGTYMRGWLARARFEQGNWDDAASEATRVLDHYRLPAAAKIPALVVLGWVRVRRGDPGSIPLLDEARTLALASGELQRIAPVAAARAEAAWLRGNQEQCLAEARVGYELALTHTDPWKLGELSIWMWRAGGLMSAPGSIAEPFARQIAGDWRGAAALWAHIGCPYEQALALADGDAEAMRNALALFERLGAQPAVALVRRQLRQQGIGGIPRGPRPSTRTNQAGLTIRQLEVLELLAEGLSNAEIASRLFTSLKTVDHHVSAVLAKLGVHSRAQAIGAAHQLELIANIGKPKA
jgi:DNA-binding CsgD family transcriptional regulator